jgi:hypothetical protein
LVKQPRIHRPRRKVKALWLGFVSSLSSRLL